MACPHPLKGWIGQTGGITFDKKKSPTRVAMQVNCGQCWSCRLQRSRHWAIRLVKEASYWPEEQRMFLTLTYNQQNLPDHGNLKVQDFQKFMKDLRYHFSTKKGNEKRQHKKIKYFHCGEYGQACRTCGQSLPYHQESKSGLKYNDCNKFDKGLGRPHYHAIIFGITFNDMEEFKKTSSGELIYKSKTLDKLWSKGFCSIGNVTFESCAYVARYIMKKVTGTNADQHYQRQTVDMETGEINLNPVNPEYITMSRNPAIAKEYFQDNMLDITKNDAVILSRQGKAYLNQPPRYFMKLLEREKPEKYDDIKNKRLRAQKLNKQTEQNLIISEKIKKIKTKTLTRLFEDYHNVN